MLCSNDSSTCACVREERQEGGQQQRRVRKDGLAAVVAETSVVGREGRGRVVAG